MLPAKRSVAVSVAAALSCAAFVAQAAPVLLTGDFVRVNITDRGVFSSLIFDPTGSGTFNPNTDYVSPGTPFEGFGVRVGTTSNLFNSNSGGQNIPGSTAAGGATADNSATWTGGDSGNLYTLQHIFFFNDNQQRVNIQTTLTALQPLSDVRVSRAVDPDPDSLAHGTSNTNNQRGISTTTPPVPTSDFVGSVGSVSGLPLGLFFSGPLTHNTGIVSACCSVTDPDVYLAGGNLGNSSVGDDGIGIAFDLGDLGTGQSVTWTYAYVMGGSLGTIDIPGVPPPPGATPEPGTLWLLGLALAGLGLLRRPSRSA